MVCLEYISTLISTPTSHDNSNYRLLHPKDFTTVRITPTLTSTPKINRYKGDKTKKERKKERKCKYESLTIGLACTDFPHTNTKKMCLHKTCHCAGLPGYYVGSQRHRIAELNILKWSNHGLVCVSHTIHNCSF